MAFTDAQMKLMRDERLRRRIPEAKGIFETIDQITARLGWGCSRLPSRYNALMDFIRRNDATLSWAQVEYPGIDFGQQANKKPKKPPATAKAPAPPVREKTVEQVRKMTVGGGVHRAIAILEKRKKRSS